jgi:soluble lytic murein transglycosylase-like protein
MLIMPAFAASPEVSSPHVKTVVRADAKSGKLVRSIVLEPGAATLPPAAELETAELEKVIDRIAGEQGVEIPLVHSVIRAESNYNPWAVSPKGAQGIMQLIPSTAKRFGVADTFDASDNILGGVRYLRFLLDYYQGDYTKAVAAYNAGEAAVDKYHGVPPFAETRNYVLRVGKNLKTARAQETKRPVQVADATPAKRPSGETPAPIRASVGSDGRVYYRTP